MKTNPKKLEALRLELRALREWADIEGSLHQYGTSEKQIWRDVGSWADGSAQRHNLDLNLPVSQPPTSPLESRGQGKSVSCAAAIPASIPNDKLRHGDRFKLYFDNFSAPWHVTNIEDGVVTLARNGRNVAIDWSQLYIGQLEARIRSGGAIKIPNAPGERPADSALPTTPKTL